VARPTQRDVHGCRDNAAGGGDGLYRHGATGTGARRSTEVAMRAAVQFSFARGICDLLFLLIAIANQGPTLLTICVLPLDARV
jgi:hypothetical protein